MHYIYVCMYVCMYVYIYIYIYFLFSNAVQRCEPTSVLATPVQKGASLTANSETPSRDIHTL